MTKNRTTSLTFFINENEDVINFFIKKNVTLTPDIQQRLAFISKKSHNNYIGYYQFEIKGTFYKFFIIPKIYKHLKTDDEKRSAFIRFFQKYYELKHKYPELKTKDIDGNIIDFSFNDFKELNSQTIQTFIQKKYEYALDILDSFFRKHAKVKYVQKAYQSQSIQNKISLKKNLKSLDKSKVHQIQKVPMAYSEIAFTARFALKYFKQNKLPNLELLFQKPLQQSSNKILNIIQKKFAVQRDFRFKERDIITNRITKLFKKNTELKKVYEALLILIGLEHFQDQKSAQDVQKLDNIVALFFNPAELYEWIVYDNLKVTFSETTIIKTDLFNQTTLNYSLKSPSIAAIQLEAKPDFIVIEKERITIIDAKWKTLTSAKTIQFEDVAKLKRDIALHQQTDELPHFAKLVYPQINFDYDKNTPFYFNYDAPFEFFINEILV